MNETTRIDLSLGTVNTKLPFKSDTVPIELLPFTTTEAPITGSPLPSSTDPLTVIPRCAETVRLLNNINRKR